MTANYYKQICSELAMGHNTVSKQLDTKLNNKWEQD